MNAYILPLSENRSQQTIVDQMNFTLNLTRSPSLMVLDIQFSQLLFLLTKKEVEFVLSLQQENFDQKSIFLEKIQIDKSANTSSLSLQEIPIIKEQLWNV